MNDCTTKQSIQISIVLKMSAISELVFEDKSIVSYVSLAREQHISIFDAEKYILLLLILEIYPVSMKKIKTN